MAILPVKKIPAIVSMPYSTQGNITKGQAVIYNDLGYVAAAVGHTNYATSVSLAGIAAETKATAASLATSNKIAVWPANPETTWEAAASGTVAQAGVGSFVGLKNNHQGVIYSATPVTTGGLFLITEMVSTSKVRGKLLDSALNGRRVPNYGGAGGTE